jgi:hypothetical protein
MLQKQLNAVKRPTQSKQPKSKSLKASDSVIANLESEVKAAAQAWDNAIETVQEALTNEHASELVKELTRAVHIQSWWTEETALQSTFKQRGAWMPGNESTLSRVRLSSCISSVHAKLLGLLFRHAHICTRKHWHEYVPCKRMDQRILRPHGKYWMPQK